MRRFIPGLGVANLFFKFFGSEMGLIQSGSGRVEGWLIFSAHCGIMVAADMKLLQFLVDSFIATFGITRPGPEKQRTVALALGGFLLVFFGGFAGLIAWMLFAKH